MGKKYIGVDLGATKILTGLFDKKGKVVTHHKTPTLQQEGPDAVIKRIIGSIERVISASNVKPSKVKSIGIGTPGQINVKKGVVLNAPNLRDWNKVKLRNIIENKFKLPVVVDNDVKSGTLGEYIFGFDKKVKNLLGIFVGSGIGGGIIINGKVYNGTGGLAGELGHVVIDVNSNVKCGCGNKGCFEALASRTALAGRIEREIKNGTESIVLELTDKFKKPVKSGVIKEAYLAGDALVKDEIKKECFYVAVACANYINVFNPEIIVLGGGLFEALGDKLVKHINKIAGDYALSDSFKNCKIVVSKLGDFAVAAGASYLARKYYKNKK